MPNSSLNASIWANAEQISVPMNGHYNLVPNRSYTLGELYAMENPLALECKEAIDHHIIDPDDIHLDQTPDIRERRWLRDAFTFMNAAPVCPNCNTYININRLFLYHPTSPQRPPTQFIAPCIMNDATKRPITYGINIPSGRLVFANDLRHLVYTHNNPFLQDNEQNNRRTIQAYANVGLLYIYIENIIDIRPDHLPDSYVIGPPDLNNAPLAQFNHESPWLHAMDGDHVEQSLHRFAPEDAKRIRETFTTINVTPGYYQLTLTSSQDIATQQSATITRIDDGIQRSTPKVTTFTIPEAITQLLSILPHKTKKFHPFQILNKHTHWALGCPTIEHTTNIYNTPSHVTPVPHDIPSLAALYNKNPDVFVPHAIMHSINTQQPIFANIPYNIAPEAIACWIAGADATMHAIMYHPRNSMPPLSQHLITQIYKSYQHFRMQLWGAAVAQHTTTMVLHHIGVLQQQLETTKPQKI